LSFYWKKGQCCGIWFFAILNAVYTGIVAEAQLRNYGSFMEEYASQLETWDFTLDPIALQVKSYTQNLVAVTITCDILLLLYTCIILHC